MYPTTISLSKMTTGQRMHQIYEKFLSRDDNVMWDLSILDAGENRIKIMMETNDAYLRGRPVMKVVLDKVLEPGDDDYIDKIPKIL